MGYYWSREKLYFHVEFISLSLIYSSSCFLTIISLFHRDSAICLEFSLNFSLKEQSLRRTEIWSAISSGDAGSIRNPEFPSETIYGIPDISGAITGVPEAIASDITNGAVSCREVITIILASENKSLSFLKGRGPGTVTFFSRSCIFINFLMSLKIGRA